uniref:glutaminase n=1 Tax=Trieres chinensis TaxID=1514140 RepID=A0A7S2EIR1_TRICV|mmetsp:Transcript_24636/g.49915  ORF Transcript_24636/g.49915 Transcript_24636/m.49915 type:complete len:307 (+) Transcript_24636:265-1185(+)|eukprot:CAMPEP_0183292258 /NCGR_PEP_ID=MMETSP0160_2-20130417/1373_1 /TAXON_ID=2839 ORGANISM="Odontella Sinensis, Strain Grunow 1884" /NCGR_SAMPLE_ID=MMETSP0160_2 /ASSEMBLY_ACC=CAM_ASM_000250 /LENGTH=306 /DNA_ID=CAMNT_0025453181 /DNA_START=265 /DNA_END=1185 /DNA_ORIENTATION=+
MASTADRPAVTIGVLALQGAFEEHQSLLESTPHLTVATRQVRTPSELEGLDGIVFPGGESTAMGLIGKQNGMWDALKDYVSSGRPVWGTCAGMILLAERCVGTSAVIAEGQALIGGVDVLVCRNYFGSQISSFEMATPAPPGLEEGGDYPGVFIRAPAILSAGPGVEVLGRVVATPCRQAAVVLRELEKKIEAGEDVVTMGVVDALVRKSEQEIDYIEVKKTVEGEVADDADGQEEKKEAPLMEAQPRIELPGAADGTNAREVICAVRRDNVLCTAFHPELTGDVRWHAYFADMVQEDVVKRGVSA